MIASSGLTAGRQPASRFVQLHRYGPIPAYRQYMPSSGTFHGRRPLWTRHSKAAEMARPKTHINEFKEILKGSNRILALCGAGLSASSGLPTFRGAGGLWREFEATTLATPEAFEADPALVWLFYAWRRHLAFKAKPNPAHYALAALARMKENFLCLTQNVDGEWYSSTFISISMSIYIYIYASIYLLRRRGTPC
jgi:hypothetical protein